MSPACIRRRGRARDERGGGLVEFAIIFPILSLFLFAIIDFGTVYANQISLRHGVREAARSAVIDNFGTDSTCTLAATTPTSPASDMTKLACLVKDRSGLSASQTYVMIWFDGALPDQIDGGIVICAMTPAKSISGVSSQFLGSGYLKTKVEMTIEQVTPGVQEWQAVGTPPAVNIGLQETPPAGTDWGFCATGSTP